LYTPAFVPGNAELIINDSTSASLSVLDDPDIFLSFDFAISLRTSSKFTARGTDHACYFDNPFEQEANFYSDKLTCGF